MNKTQSVLDSLNLGDFANHKLLRSYLADHKVEIVTDTLDNGVSHCYWMCWPYGFLLMCSTDRGIKFAERWAFLFVWHWLRGVPLPEVEDLVWSKLKR